MTNEKQICEFEFSISGMLRFVSHLELQNFFAKLFVRAGIPVKFSEGFNPHPRLSLPVPRNVGVGSIDDRGRIEVDAGFDTEAMLEKLRPILPFEMVVSCARVLPASRLERVMAVAYEIDTADYPAAKISDRIVEIMKGPCLVTRRVKRTNRENTVDLRPMIQDLALSDGRVRARVAYTAEGSVKPMELLEILGLPAEEFTGKITRIKTYWVGS
jgi:radical SAM-linked protein